MKAMAQDRYGSPDVLEFRDVEMPDIGDDDVLLRVHAAAVNPADWAFMRGVPYLFRPFYGLFRPRIRVRGTDVAGVVEVVGRNVRTLRPGDQVFGEGRGSFAEHVAAAEKRLAIKPANLTFEEAAAIPMAALTALVGLRDAAGVQPGQRVLVNGASGGVGTFAVQIAKWLGAEVTGVCRTGNLDMVRSLGADQVVDYTREDFSTNEGKYDVILDNAASHSLSDTMRSLTARGTLLPNNGNLQSPWLASLPRLVRAVAMGMFGSRSVKPFLATTRREDLIVLRDLIEGGIVAPVIDRTYPLAETPDAIGYVGEGHARAKVVVAVAT